MSNLYKQWGVAPKQEGARIINSNAIVAQKIEEMAKKMREQAGTEVDFTDGFSQGLGAEKAERAAMTKVKQKQMPKSRRCKDTCNS